MDDYIIEPLFDNILVLPEEKAKQTATGIILPNESGEAPTIGEVIATGRGKYIPEYITKGTADRMGGTVISQELGKIPMDIKAGDRVLYKQWGTTSVKMNGKEYFILKQDDVLALIHKKPQPAPKN